MIDKKAQKKAAKAFAERWKDRGYEKGDSQTFWIDLLTNVYGVENIAGFIEFENKVLLEHVSFIDGYIPSTSVMIEQKSIGKDLRKGIKQSDGSMLNPFQQAKRYVTELPRYMHPKWIVTCNFAEFLVYDMDKPNGEPEQIFLKDLEKDYYRLQFLVDKENENLKKEMEISLKAGELVGKLYDAIKKQYKDPDSAESLKSLNMLCVRLVFCLYAEDAGIFGQHEMFGNYLKKYPAGEIRKKLIELFEVLNTVHEKRDPYMEDDLAAFPYVNGGLFADEKIEIPRFTDEIADLLINKASAGFDWSEISPTIFGAVFESTLNPETRRSGGMHYTSISNIHKVIDPLFLDDLYKEYNNIITETKVDKTRRNKLELFRDKLASLVFLDPACGSGNFLTETYISLRRLENMALSEINQGQIMFGGEGELDPIKVGIGQFYGIEINDFAVTVAKTALWIAESQMLHETEEIVRRDIDFLPLKSYANITEGNALRIDWKDVVPVDRLSYIMGNPPFRGGELSELQREDRNTLFNGEGGELDYVACWYKKAENLIKNTAIECAFVSTNSICQGQQVYPLWYNMLNNGIIINFAYRTFQWDSEANIKAHVHCIIIGFSYIARSEKIIYNNGKLIKTDYINAYLLNAPNVIIEKRRKPICDVPSVIKGFQPTDNGYLILSSNEKEEMITKEPNSAKWIKPFITAKEYIHGIDRYCLWLVGISPKELNQLKEIKKRVVACYEWRSEQKTSGDAYKLKDCPSLMRPSSKFKDGAFIVMPRHSSEDRRYIPFGYADNGSIPGDSISLLPDATLYHFGVLCSNVHMSFVRVTCGRIKSDFRYTSDVVYNNFPWCNPTDEQKAKIEQTAQMILDARAKYPDCSLADLYDETTMPPELRKAHQLNDKAVMQAYGFSIKMTESECVAELMKMYRELTEKK